MYQVVKALCARVALSVVLLLSEVDTSRHWRNNLGKTLWFLPPQPMAVVGIEPKSQATNSAVWSAQRFEDEIWKCLIFLLRTFPSPKRQEQTASILLGALQQTNTVFSLCREFRLEVLRQIGLRLSEGGEGIFAQKQFSLSHLSVTQSRWYSDKEADLISTFFSAILRQNPIVMSETSDKSKKSKKHRGLWVWLGYAEPWRGSSW